MSKNAPEGLRVDNAMGHHRATHTYMALALGMVGVMVTVMVMTTTMTMEGEALDEDDAEALEVEAEALGVEVLYSVALLVAYCWVTSLVVVSERLFPTSHAMGSILLDI